jgi:hypothetical protein
MPGVYDQGATSLKMKPYVDIEGSGDGSVITSQVTNPERPCPLGTVNMANNSTLRNIRVTNSGNATTPSGMIASVIFQNASATLESVSVLNGSDTLSTDNDHSVAVCAEDNSNATLNNVRLEARGASNSHTVVLNTGTTMKINNASIIASSSSSTRPIDCNGHDYTTNNFVASLYITNSYLESSNLGTGMVVADDCKNVDIVNSRLVFNSDSFDFGLVRGGTMNDSIVKFMNVQIYNQKSATIPLDGGYKIAFSMIQNGKTAFTDPATKVTSCVDENFEPIQNQ